MMERIIIGRYIKRESLIHRLDPRSKTISILLFMVAVFLINSYTQALFMTLFAALIMILSRIPLSYYLKAVKPLLLLILFIFLFHLLFDASGKRLIEIGPVALYSGGLAKGVISAARMTLFIAFSAILTFTTQPDRLTQAFGRLLAPLRRAGLSIDKLTVMLNVALRFIPTIFEETHRLYKAQLSRGLNLDEQSLAKKAKLMIALLIPVTNSVLRRAIHLADSMEARGYRINDRRTDYRILTWSQVDTWYLLSFLIPIVAVLAL